MANWLAIELAAVDAWAALGVVPPDDARACRERAAFDVAAVQGRERTTRHDVAAFVDVVAASIGEQGRWIHHGLDLVGCARHRARPPAACECGRAARRPRNAARRRQAARARVPRHGLHGPLARDPRRADVVRAQARGVRVPTGARSHAAAACTRGGRRRRDQRRRRFLRERRSRGGAARLRGAGPQASRGLHPGDPARPPCRVHCGAGDLRLHARQPWPPRSVILPAPRFARCRSRSPKDRRARAPCRTSGTPSSASA